jgi:hypothetical protein
MIPLADLFDIPNEALTLLLLIALSLVNWIKNRFLTEQEKKQQEQVPEDPMREVVWRRQTGETAVPRPPPGGRRSPPPIPAGTIRLNPRPAAAPPARRAVPVVTPRQAALADAFEKSQSSRKTSRTGHRREIDKLLRSPSAAQNAILLTEILGPPVALRPHQDPFN